MLKGFKKYFCINWVNIGFAHIVLVCRVKANNEIIRQCRCTVFTLFWLTDGMEHKGEMAVNAWVGPKLKTQRQIKWSYDPIDNTDSRIEKDQANIAWFIFNYRDKAR